MEVITILTVDILLFKNDFYLKALKIRPTMPVHNGHCADLFWIN